jgi:hypothetical protein
VVTAVAPSLMQCTLQNVEIFEGKNNILPIFSASLLYAIATSFNQNKIFS